MVFSDFSSFFLFRNEESCEHTEENTHDNEESGIERFLVSKILYCDRHFECFLFFLLSVRVAIEEISLSYIGI